MTVVSELKRQKITYLGGWVRPKYGYGFFFVFFIEPFPNVHADCIKSFINSSGQQLGVSNRLTVDIACENCKQEFIVNGWGWHFCKKVDKNDMCFCLH